MSDFAKTVVTIFDQTFRIGSDSADPEAIQAAAEVLDGRMRKVAGASRRRVPQEVAILAAMEIADEILGERDRHERLVSEADQRISRFTRRLEGGSLPSAGGDPAPAS